MVITRNDNTNTRAHGIDYAFNGLEAVITSFGVPRKSRSVLQLATPLLPAALAVAREATLDPTPPAQNGQPQPTPGAWDRNWWNIALPLAVGALGVGVLAFTRYMSVQKRG